MGAYNGLNGAPRPIHVGPGVPRLNGSVAEEESLLEAYWKLDGNGADFTGNGHTATPSSITFASGGGNGKINQGAGFTSIASTLIASSGVDILGDLSVSAWVYPTASGDYFTIVAHIIGGGAATTNYHLIMLPGAAVALLGVNDVGVSTTPGVTLTLNTWTHVVATRTAAGYTEIWLNGVKRGFGSGPAANSLPAANTYIGCRGDSYSYFHGAIDEVGIWGEVISDAMIASLYNAGAGRQPPFP